MDTRFHRVRTFELTNSTDRREYEDLVNSPDTQVLGENDFFGVGGSEEGPVPFLTRLVDYRGPDPVRASRASQPVYTAPVC